MPVRSPQPRRPEVPTATETMTRSAPRTASWASVVSVAPSFNSSERFRVLGARSCNGYMAGQPLAHITRASESTKAIQGRGFHMTSFQELGECGDYPQLASSVSTATRSPLAQPWPARRRRIKPRGCEPPWSSSLGFRYATRRGRTLHSGSNPG